MSNALLASQSHDNSKLYPSAGHLLSKAESTINLKQRELSTYILPTSQIVPQVLQSGAFDLEFIIKPSDLAYADSIYLEYQLNNANGATAANLVDGWCHFEWVDVLVNNKVCQTNYGIPMRNSFILGHTNEQMSTILPQVGVSTTDFSANLSIPAASTVTVRTPIRCFLSTAEVPLWGSRVEYRLRFRLRTGSQLVRLTSPVSAPITDVTVVSGTVQLLP